VPFRRFDDGAEIPFDVDWFRIDDLISAKPLYFATISRDLTAQKRAGAVTEQLNSSLARDHASSEASAKLSALSRREREVLDALVAGGSNKTIAFGLGISVRTVEVHRARILERLGVRNSLEMIRLAVTART
jgi:FixJ family two-component response regulator